MGILKSIGSFFFGKKPKMQQTPRFTSEQQAALNNLLRMGMSDVSGTGLEDRYKKQFEESTIPGLAERFTSMGEGQRSSAFEGILGRAGSDLTSQLAALRNQAAMQKLQMGLQPQFDTAYMPGTPGMLEGIMGPAFSMLAGKALLGGDKAKQMFGQGSGPQYYPGQPQGYGQQQTSNALLKLLSGLMF